LAEAKERSGARGASGATAVGLAVAMLLPMPPYREPFLGLLMKEWSLSWIEAWEFIGLISKLTVIIAIPLLVVYWERKRLASIGVRRMRLHDLLAVVVVLVGYLLVEPLVDSIASKVPAMAEQLMRGDEMYWSLPKLLDWSGLIANGIAEEVGFRGYAIERIEKLTDSTSIGALLPFVVNVLMHAPVWGFYGMLAKAPILLLLVALYLWRRNLPACVLVHLLIDIRFEL
jgi:uncharacterized protein